MTRSGSAWIHISSERTSEKQKSATSSHPLHQARSPSRDQAHTRRQLSLFLTRVLLEEDRVLGSGDVEALADKSREARDAGFGQVLKAVRDDGADLRKGCTVCQLSNRSGKTPPLGCVCGVPPRGAGHGYSVIS